MHFQRPAQLDGQTLFLEALQEKHRGALRSISDADQGIWTYFPATFNGAGPDFDAWFDYTLQKSDRREHCPFAVIRRDGGVVLGTTRYYDLVPEHRRLAIGSTWYVREARGTLVNCEVRLITLSYAFEVLNVDRVELIADPYNLASRTAMKILGAKEEGRLRRHLIYKDGRVRDSVVYSIIGEEWAAVKQRLVGQLAGGARSEGTG
jgi:RimJ/RimL family protein N-acetyltransferase